MRVILIIIQPLLLCNLGALPRLFRMKALVQRLFSNTVLRNSIVGFKT